QPSQQAPPLHSGAPSLQSALSATRCELFVLGGGWGEGMRRGRLSVSGGVDGASPGLPASLAGGATSSDGPAGSGCGVSGLCPRTTDSPRSRSGLTNIAGLSCRSFSGGRLL